MQLTSILQYFSHLVPKYKSKKEEKVKESS